ncbi:sulfoacetaldehyde acetyltransferase [Sinorhizobium medicae]|uniref:Sulfoacetaldehyde acetyltransferase n=2 Tax=Sinorhizobium medicae TaxID=110321 RepID=A0ABX4TT57_9HYPH|nr:sulfoacetaldehyde acetyltransferase [Sinorhizobium medicae]MDX0456722.1 sulfoacetaldehyde acetyltransferase [Sinorhizobium medicae]MDX0517813.1 sulfoacetaldehyde acetyltransferase [Sinorhizobium medicae]MDX0728274.1 sulfoacetaldehyde acetyltransferase [Sinorhizobium medicae]MDX0734532.1 sulfoacetaldehyde acetyltransferase [Sinorhizobium medicae]MDX0814387.1 sulfoacetaldehyde acetyltransferase [Sinorhizobium medicae]
MKMTTEEAFVKVLQMHGIEHAFGIIGSAMMPVSDLFPKAGIKFWDCAHETNAGMMADGFSRATGTMSMAIGQNGPGVTGFITAMKTAYWNHTPLLMVTPQAANKTIGQGGFQEVDQMAMFEEMVCYQEEVRDPSRIPEVLNRVIEKAWRGCAPAQINIPRDFWTHVIDVDLPRIVRFERPAGGPAAIAQAARLLSEAKFPVILNGAGVVIGNAIQESMALAERLDAPVCCGYQHNDAFPGSHRLSVGPLGYNGSKAAMELISKADVVLALGTRLNPFSTLPGYGIDYWPKNASIIQVDINPDRIGLTKKVTVGICGDAKQVAQQILQQLAPVAGEASREERKALVHQTRSAWLQQLSSMDHEDDDPGTEWNVGARQREPDRMSPRQVWRAIQAVLPKEAIISTDIGNNCAIGNAYPSFEQGRKYLAPGMFGPCGYGFPSIVGAKIGCPDAPVVGFAGDGAFGISMNEMTSIGREGWPAITMVIFRNYQWGAEKRNTTLWYDNNFVGTELNPNLSYAKVADGCGLKGITVDTPAALKEALSKAIEDQARGITTFVEVILNQELGEPFRRDAMKKPVAVAGIDRADMQPQSRR